MKILLVTEVFPPRKGGSGRWLWELYRRLRPAFDIHVVAGATAGDESFDRGAELPIERLPLYFSNWGLWSPRGAYEYARVAYRMRSILSRVRPDVIHCGKCLPEGLVATFIQRCWGIPFCCYAHGEELTLARTSGELRRLTTRVLHEAAIVIANSEHSRKILVEDWQLSDRTVTVMHPGVDAGKFRPAAPDDAVRARLGWTNRQVVLTVGALQKRKGQDMLIRALPAIRRRCPAVLYAIAGEEWEREYIDALVCDLNVRDLVQFRGVPDEAELVDCYQQCDLFALPNRQVNWDIEGFGIVLLEAQACGKAVVAGASGGTAEAMEADRTGLLVDCATPDRLGELVGDLLQDPARAAAMGRRGREWVASNFDWKVLTPAAADLFSGTSMTVGTRTA
jgi:phosphatidylinositol alpha-1,6-mannosyltransferase